MKLLKIIEDINQPSPQEETQRKLDPSVSYMEIEDEAGGFSCGTCKFFKSENSYCMNKKVMAEVNPDHGCCNLFYPANSKVIFP